LNDINVLGSRSRGRTTRKDGHVAALLAPALLRAADRCDRCGAQAYLRAVLPAGGELLFCVHHGREYSDLLRAKGAQITDESERLAPVVASDDGR
jgi:hypothetical protein